MTSGRGKRRFLLSLCLLCTFLFSALGVWQVERRALKLQLIDRVEARVHAPPVAAPPAGRWATLTRDDAEYRRVRATGTFLHDKETPVDALTELGPGYWVLTPLRTRDGIILVNRGFVPPERRARASRPDAQPTGVVNVTGLLRWTEPGGRFLRPNRPGENRWFSRDVAAIARSRGLSGVAPYFIDAEAAGNRSGIPVPGMTVVRFRNMHLFYAVTWFALAGLSLVACVLLARAREEAPR